MEPFDCLVSEKIQLRRVCLHFCTGGESGGPMNFSKANGGFRYSGEDGPAQIQPEIVSRNGFGHALLLAMALYCLFEITSEFSVLHGVRMESKA